MNTKEIRKWKIDLGLEWKKVARDIRVSPALVGAVIRGERVSGPKAQKVIRKLKRLGCPPEFLENSGQGSVASGQ